VFRDVFPGFSVSLPPVNVEQVSSPRRGLAEGDFHVVFTLSDPLRRIVRSTQKAMMLGVAFVAHPDNA